jgi:hypothetical protein
MSESTQTLQALRRALCIEMKMPFFRRYSAGYSEIDANSTSSKIIDSSLSQKDNFWNGSWFYAPGTGEVSLIRSFQANSNSLALEVPLASTPSAGDDYEIHELWNAIDLRHFINQAILEGGRTWSETITDESLVLEQDKLSYTISGLTRKPWIVTKVFIENRSSVSRGRIQSATNNTFTVESSSTFSSVVTASDWRVSIYYGTGKGQIRTLSSHTGSQGTISANWTTNPDSTSKYAFWNATEDWSAWIPLDSYTLDSKEYPDTIHFYRRMESFYGMRLRIEYLSEPLELSAESDTTTVPKRWIIPFAAALMMGQRMSDTKSDREIFESESIRYMNMAEDFRTRNAPHKPDITLKTPALRSSYIPNGNPLDWSK